MANSDNKVKYVVENHDFPLKINMKLKWKCLNWSLEKWCELIGPDVLEFRVGTFNFTETPQYENRTSSCKGTIKDLLAYNLSENKWAYFDYKYLKFWLKDIPELRQDISWDVFGYPEIGVDDSTIWIGTKGAHSNCHIDTYGVNIVVQVFGRKQWILFPPDENLKATRIPYEESTIYSKCNLFSPTLSHYDDVDNCYNVLLEPGDILFIPNGWWHYVENLDVSISINTWIPLKSDSSQRVHEAVVQMLVGQLTCNLPIIDRLKILVPNAENEYLSTLVAKDHLNIISKTIKEVDSVKLPPKDDATLNSLVNNKNYFKSIIKLSRQDFTKLLIQKRQRFSSNNSIAEIVSPEQLDNIEILQRIIDGSVNRKSIDSMLQKLFNK